MTGYSAGLYGTWCANQAEKNGAYADSWALYNWLENKVNGEQQKAENYKSKSVTASMEGGHSFKLGESNVAMDDVKTYQKDAKDLAKVALDVEAIMNTKLSVWVKESFLPHWRQGKP